MKLKILATSKHKTLVIDVDDIFNGPLAEYADMSYNAELMARAYIVGYLRGRAEANIRK